MVVKGYTILHCPGESLQGRASRGVWELEVNLRKQRISLPPSGAPTHKLQCEQLHSSQA